MLQLTSVVGFILFPSVIVANFCGSYFNITDGCDLTYGDVLETIANVRSIERCAGQCNTNNQCVSVKYNPVNKDCQFNSETYTILGTGCSAMFKYAKLTKTTCRKVINEGCTYSAECMVTHSQCLLGTCQCDPGYSYDGNNGSCVTSCAVYGSTFTMHPGYYLSNHNDKIVTGINSGAACEQLCAAQTTFLCRTADYRNDNLQCYMSTATALSTTNIYQLATDPSTHDHYYRNCL